MSKLVKNNGQRLSTFGYFSLGILSDALVWYKTVQKPQFNCFGDPGVLSPPSRKLRGYGPT